MNAGLIPNSVGERWKHLPILFSPISLNIFVFTIPILQGPAYRLDVNLSLWCWILNNRVFNKTWLLLESFIAVTDIDDLYLTIEEVEVEATCHFHVQMWFLCCLALTSRTLLVYTMRLDLTIKFFFPQKTLSSQYVEKNFWVKIGRVGFWTLPLPTLLLWRNDPFLPITLRSKMVM